MKIIWREWFSPATIAALIKMGTLPREECEVPDFIKTGREAAVSIAWRTNAMDPEQFREGGLLVIIEPMQFAGTYRIIIDYEPTFYAERTQENEV